jgi:hypothetical protein
VFISLFALDAFGEGIPFLEALLGFFIHLIPTFITIAILLIAWKREMAGGILYLLLSGSYLVFMRIPHWTVFLLIGGPPILIGLLFISTHLISKNSLRQ